MVFNKHHNRMATHHRHTTMAFCIIASLLFFTAAPAVVAADRLTSSNAHTTNDLEQLTTSSQSRHLQEPLMLEPGPYMGSALGDMEEVYNVTAGVDSPWSQEPEDDDAINGTTGHHHRSTLQFTAGNCRIKVANKCNKTRFFVIAYRTTKNKKNGMYSEGWFNVQPGVTAVIPTQIKTTESLAGRQWYIRFGDGIKLRPQLVSRETARCIDNVKPFQFFSEGTAKLAYRYPGGKYGSCRALGGVPGHGFYVISPALCKKVWTYTFGPGAGNCR